MIRNGFFTAARCCLFLAFVCTGQMVFAGPASVPVDRPGSLSIVNDPRTGLALFGYDPVAFHSDSLAKEGRSEFSTTYLQLEWRFASLANREAFLADPAAFIPAFGGHDGHAISEGHMTSGDPLFFAISLGELVLFRTAETRDRFRADAALRNVAFSRWPEVSRQHGSH